MVIISPIDLEIARNEYAAVAEEMGVVLRRTAYSPNIKERVDCSAAVFIASGEMLAQAEHIPVHLGSMPASVAAVVDRFGSDVADGIQYAVNDPFYGGTHLNDLTIVRPVFDAGDLIGWVGNRAHHADVGGEAPGSMPAHAVRVDQEGIVVPPTAAVRDGEWIDAFLVPFLNATRTPSERLGDLSAQLGANEVGAARFLALARRDGPARFGAITSALLDYGERRMEAAIAELPDGSYSFVDVMEWKDDDLAIAVTLTLDGGRLHADFRGTVDQIAGNINAVEAVTRSCLYFAVRVAADPTIPPNGGSYRPITLGTRPSSLVSATAPVAVAAGNVETSQRIADTLLGALAQAVPDRVPAASQGTMNNILIGSDHFAYYETVAGGQGARPGRHGQSGIQSGMTNTKNTPTESLEQHYPFTVVRYSLRRGSGGDGQYQGGEGIERELEFSEPSTLSLMGERRRHGPWGLNGGGAGATGEDWLIRGSSPERLPGKVTVEVRPGDRLLVRTPGGGGWGTP
ncbi:MAG: hydantoinase B/oxoprolinase family protein [Acidimicrobiia bacterium]|nr:hydantoinase B/oxoprolinase family protein [Acidimicrobiia bacterium]